jgi:hypothetical protein
MSRPTSDDPRFQRARRRLPERVTRLRWLRDATADPPDCERRTVIDDAEVWVRPDGNALVELRVDPTERAQRLADEFFGQRYETRPEAGAAVFVGRPL